MTGAGLEFNFVYYVEYINIIKNKKSTYFIYHGNLGDFGIVLCTITS